MICEYCNKGTLHTLNNQELESQLSDCKYCYRVKDDIFEKKLELSLYKAPDSVWENISKELPPTKEIKVQDTHVSIIWKAAAVFLILSMAAFMLTKITGNDNPNILSGLEFQRMEFLETQYLNEIDKIEKAALPEMFEYETDIYLLYRDKLEVIDRQLALYREGLKESPGNAHIRRYYLAALQDKKNTLKEILQMETKEGE